MNAAPPPRTERDRGPPRCGGPEWAGCSGLHGGEEGAADRSKAEERERERKCGLLRMTTKGRVRNPFSLFFPLHFSSRIFFQTARARPPAMADSATSSAIAPGSGAAHSRVSRECKRGARLSFNFIRRFCSPHSQSTLFHSPLFLFFFSARHPRPRSQVRRPHGRCQPDCGHDGPRRRPREQLLLLPATPPREHRRRPGLHDLHVRHRRGLARRD